MEEKKETNFDEIVAKMTSEVQNKFKEGLDGVTTKLNDFDQKIEALKQKEAKNTTEDDDDQDEELVLTRKDIKKMLDEERTETEKKFRGIVNDSLNVYTTKGEWDSRTTKDFPMLNSSSPVYSKEFYADVQKEVGERVKSGTSNEDPRLVWDSAAAVFARNPKYQKLSQTNLQDEIRDMNNNDAQFSMRNRGRKTSSEPGQHVLSLASKLGLSHEKVKEHYKKLANRY